MVLDTLLNRIHEWFKKEKKNKCNLTLPLIIYIFFIYIYFTLADGLIDTTG